MAHTMGVKGPRRVLMGRVGVSVPILAILAIAAATGCGEPVVSPSPTLHASTTAAAQETIEATASATPGTTSVEQQPMSVINGTALAAPGPGTPGDCVA